MIVPVKNTSIIISFYKKGQCDLNKKNCYIVEYFYIKDKNISNLKTYYDYTGKTTSVKLLPNK